MMPVHFKCALSIHSLSTSYAPYSEAQGQTKNIREHLYIGEATYSEKNE